MNDSARTLLQTLQTLSQAVEGYAQAALTSVGSAPSIQQWELKAESALRKLDGAAAALLRLPKREEQLVVVRATVTALLAGWRALGGGALAAAPGMAPPAPRGADMSPEACGAPAAAYADRHRAAFDAYDCGRRRVQYLMEELYRLPDATWRAELAAEAPEGGP